MKKTWLTTSIAYGMWIVFILVGILTLLVSRNSLSGYLDIYAQGSFQHSKEAQFLNQAFFFVAGLVLLILLIVVEEYFKQGVRKGNLSRRISKAFGIEILTLFLASIANAFLIGFSPLIDLVLLLELAAGGLLTWFGVQKPGIVNHNQGQKSI